MKRFLIGLAMLGVGCSIDSGTTEGKEKSSKENSFASFLPENDFHRTKRYYAAGEVTEDDFDLILSAAEEIYAPIIASFGAELVVSGAWEDNTVNAYANQDGNRWEVSFFGGLARHPEMTFYGFSLVVCHELFHHLGGFPVYSNSEWNAAIEGQSDYGAAAACARKMFDQNSPMRVWGRDLMKKKKKPTEPPGQKSCSGFYGIDKEVCEITLEGGLSLGRVLAELNGEKAPSYSTPSKVVVSKTMEKHPDSQCRLDTYLAGALCNKTWEDRSIPRSKSEADKVSCAKPKCWYKS
jgi:hypothetical protein